MILVDDKPVATKYDAKGALKMSRKIAIYKEKTTIYLSFSPEKMALSLDAMIFTGLQFYKLRQVTCILYKVGEG